MPPVRVLIVDDSAMVRQILTQGLGRDPEIIVVGAARDPYEARDKIVQLQPHVLTLDVEMPKMDGVEFLRRLMPQYPLPVVMVSSLTGRGQAVTMAALEAGAVDFVTKPSAMGQGLESMIGELSQKIKVAARANVSHWKGARPAPAPLPAALAQTTDKVVAIGASTGGTEALKEVLSALPGNFPGIVVVQHMPAGFTRTFAQSLSQCCKMEVKEAQEGDRVMTGRVLIAPGDYHMEVRRDGGRYIVGLTQMEKVNSHRPSVDVLMHSVARACGGNAVGVILTGMGRDGAAGLLAMRRAGARTIGQDEASSIVYGMPAAAAEIGAVENVRPLSTIAEAMLRVLQ